MIRTKNRVLLSHEHPYSVPMDAPGKTYHLNGFITSPDGESEPGSAEVFIPEISLGHPWIELDPESDPWLYGRRFKSGSSFHAEHETGSRTYVLQKIDAHRVLGMRSSIRDRGFGVGETINRSEIVDVSHYRYRSDNVPQGPTTLTFLLSRNPALSAQHSVTHRWNGVREVEFRPLPITKISDELTIEFDHHYHWTTNDDHESATAISYRVFVGKIEGNWHDFHRVESSILPAIRDAVLLLSFATQQRTSCLGWDAVTPDGSISQHRIGLAKIPDLGGHQRALISSTKCFHHPCGFLAKAWEPLKALKGDEQRAILTAIDILLESQNQTPSVAFPSMFGALEHVVQADARARNLRLPMGKHYPEMIKQLGVEIPELWPVYEQSKSGRIGLNVVRNKVLHGEFDISKGSRSVHVAEMHMRWTLQAIILRKLAWPLEDSSVWPGFLAYQYPKLLRDMSEIQKEAKSAIITAS